jgi:hypothetical protein
MTGKSTVNEHKCATCKGSYPRVLYRKKGGGVHPNCPKCRKKVANTRQAIKKKIVLLADVIKGQQEQAARESQRRALMTEYLDITRSNRTRIAAMVNSGSERAYTHERIRIRTELQDAWGAGLAKLMAALDEGREITTLYEYMHGV